MLMDQVEGQERMAQMIENAQKQDDVEPLADAAHVVNRELTELDLDPGDLGGEGGLGQIVGIGIDGHDPLGAAALHLDGVEAAVAADVEHGLAGEIGRDGVREALPFDVGIVAQEMLGRGPDAAQPHVVEPWSQLVDALAGQLLVGHDAAAAAMRHWSAASSWAPAKAGGSLSPRARGSSRAAR